MTVVSTIISLHTRGNTDIHDITEEVGRAVAQSGIDDGIVTIFCPSATSALTTVEFESGCLADLRETFDRIASPDGEYAHNARWGDGNGHSHIRAALLGPSLTVPFRNRRLSLGTWQQIIHLDFDIRARRRELTVQVMGE